ncbi:MAG: cupin domain-containing protein [Chitinophagaceae bacterium]|nr:cupin domain-containing protein [Chitinophagaceae bacterium]
MYNHPHTIENKIGEKLCFTRLVKEDGVDKLEVENWVQPGAGPLMHVHWKQDESLTVISGKIGTQIPGEEPRYYGPGETVTFYRGTWHRFWNAGNDVLNCKGWIKPADNIEYYLTEIYKAIDAGKNHRPEPTAAAFLMTRYKSEFDVSGIPGVVKKVIIPLQYFIGRFTGAHKRFKDAPQPVK